MHRWSVQQRSFAVEVILINNETFVTTRRTFRTPFNLAPPPNNWSISKWVENFVNTVIFSLKPLHTSSNCRDTQECGSCPSVRWRKSRTFKKTSRPSTWYLTYESSNHHKKHLMFRFIRLWLSRKSFLMTRIQSLQFREHTLNILEDELAVIITSDEAHFHLNGHVSKQNCRYWANETPRELHQNPLHDQKVTVGCALSKVEIIGSYFYKLIVDRRWRGI